MKYYTISGDEMKESDPEFDDMFCCGLLYEYDDVFMDRFERMAPIYRFEVVARLSPEEKAYYFKQIDVLSKLNELWDDGDDLEEKLEEEERLSRELAMNGMDPYERLWRDHERRKRDAYLARDIDRSQGIFRPFSDYYDGI